MSNVELTAAELMAKFRSADLKTRIEMARLGFELETQSTMGLKYESCNDEVDHDSMREYAWERAKEIAADIAECMHEIQQHLIPIFRDMEMDKCVAVMRSLEISGLEDLCRAGICRISYNTALDNIADTVAQDLDRDDFLIGDKIENHLILPENMEVVQDSSVEGFEFRTIDGLTMDQAMAAAHKILEYDHEIDHKCSFHVHVSIPGVKHAWGATLQAAMTEYLLENIDQIPEAVRKRWSKTHEYFRPRISRDKYTFVHMHSQGTWEFRCFGNVKNAADAQKCMELALDALQYGYKALNRDVVLLKDIAQLTQDDFADVCETAMKRSTRLSTAVDAYVQEMDVAA